MLLCGSNTYGIHKETLERVHIEAAKNGLKCNCMCPACQADLIARNNGKKRAQHFAHASGTACKWAGETDVHLMAKEILSQKKCLCFPAYKGEAHCVNLAMRDFESVTCEPFIDGKRPDCVCVWKDDDGHEINIWVEIKVTHPVDDDKLELIKAQGITCIEIDLKQFANHHKLTDDFEVAVLESAERVWLNAPFLDEIDRKKVEEVNQARQKRNEELRAQVAHDLKEQFDNDAFFEILVPCLNVCDHRDKCACVSEKDCTRHGQRMINMKNGIYNLCDVLPSNTDNKVIVLRSSIKPVEPLYIAVYGEKEKFPDTMDGKVIAIHMRTPQDTKPLYDINFSYRMDNYPCEYDEDDYYPSKRYYNLEEKDREVEWDKTIEVYSFELHRTGKWHIDTFPCKDQFNTDKKGVLRKLFHIQPHTLFDKSMYGMVLALEAGHKVKHCSICKYHSGNIMGRLGWCNKPEVGPKIESWSALSCAHFERNDELIQKVKKDQPQLYKSI